MAAPLTQHGWGFIPCLLLPSPPPDLARAAPAGMQHKLGAGLKTVLLQCLRHGFVTVKLSGVHECDGKG